MPSIGSILTFVFLALVLSVSGAPTKIDPRSVRINELRRLKIAHNVATLESRAVAARKIVNDKRQLLGGLVSVVSNVLASAPTSASASAPALVLGANVSFQASTTTTVATPSASSTPPTNFYNTISSCGWEANACPQSYNGKGIVQCINGVCGLSCPGGTKLTYSDSSASAPYYCA